MDRRIVYPRAIRVKDEISRIWIFHLLTVFIAQCSGNYYNAHCILLLHKTVYSYTCFVPLRYSIMQILRLHSNLKPLKNRGNSLPTLTCQVHFLAT